MHRQVLAFALSIGIATIAWQAGPVSQAGLARAIWLWDPGPMLADAGARASMFEFLQRERIPVVWAQVGTEGSAVKSAPAWRGLIAEATKHRIQIEALDGAPMYAIQEHLPKGVAEAVIAYNESVSAGERFAGIHFDIEPYLLWSWRSPQSRKQILRQYLDVLQWCKARIAKSLPGMQLGADIPFWWQVIDDSTGRAIGDVEFAGESKAASFHVIDLLDNVGIMNYRNRAAGRNGMIANGEELLAYADRAKKAAIWMGVETSRDQPTPVWFVVGLPRDLAAGGLSLASDIRPDLSYRDFQISLFDDGANLHVGLRLRGVDPAHPSAVFMEALSSLARRYGVLSRPGPADRGSQARTRMLGRLTADPEWRDAAALSIVDPETHAEYPGVVATAVMLPALTFDGLPPETFRRETSAAEQAFAKHSSYRGLAIHHYESYRKLMGGPAGASAPSLNLRLDPPRY